MGASAPPRPVIRDAVDDDLPAIQRIYAEYVIHGLASFEETPPDLAEMGRRRQAVRAQGLPYLAAELGGRLSGFAYATGWRDRPAYRYTVEDSLYVAPEERRPQARTLGRYRRHAAGLGRRLRNRALTLRLGPAGPRALAQGSLRPSRSTIMRLVDPTMMAVRALLLLGLGTVPGQAQGSDAAADPAAARVAALRRRSP